MEKNFVGEFKDGKRNGQGTHTWPNGEKFVGEYRDDKRNGKGTYTWPDGRTYVGEWTNDTQVEPSADNSSNKATTSALGLPEKTDGYLPLILLAVAAIAAIFLMKGRTKPSIGVSSPTAVTEVPATELVESDLENGPRPVDDAEMDAWRASLEPLESRPHQQEQVVQQPSPTSVSQGFKYYNGNGVAQDYKAAKMSTKFTLFFVACALVFLITLGEMEPYGSKSNVIADKALQGGIVGGILWVAAVLINALWNAIKGALSLQQKSSENGKIQSEKNGLIVSTPAAKQGSQEAAFMSNLSDAQIKIIVTSMVIVATVLPVIFLRFGYLYEYKDCLRLVSLYDRTSPISPYSLNDEWGLLARSGAWGVLLGIVAPISLWATAALIATGRRESR